MMIMEGSKLSKTEYDLKAIMYSAYDTTIEETCIFLYFWQCNCTTNDTYIGFHSKMRIAVFSYDTIIYWTRVIIY